jgi:hypothetical protein
VIGWTFGELAPWTPQDGLGIIRATMSCRILVLTFVTALGSVGCGLSEGEARTLVEQRLAEASARSCLWNVVLDGRYMDVEDRGIRACVGELEKAGIAKPGACHDKTPHEAGCLDRELVPSGGAEVTADGLAFGCGTYELVDIRSVTKTSNGHTYVDYSRRFDDRLMAEIPHCATSSLSHPKMHGVETRQIRVMTVSGNWWMQELRNGAY